MLTRISYALFLFCLPAWAQDDALAPLRATLEQLRRHRNDVSDHPETRGARPDLTLAKHQLRDWFEQRLARVSQMLGAAWDENATNRELQDALAGLSCPDGCVTSALGFVDPVRLHRESEFLIVQTSVGIRCGYDDSAYVYRWNSRGNGRVWRRIFEAEQNVYTKTGYRPQTIYAVRISPPGSNGKRLVLTLGTRPGCSGAFQPFYYKIWALETAPHSRPKMLLDAVETAYVGDYPPVKGTVSANDVRIEFTAGGTGYGSGHRAVRHFEVRGTALKQVEPIAPTPRDFVEEWLSASWKQSAPLSESSSLESWHRKLHRDDGTGDFPDPTLECANDPELRQIGIRLHGIPAETFYLVRWRQPDRFTMVDIAEHPLCK